LDLVADKFAAALGQDQRIPDQVSPLLLAAFGQKASHPATFWQVLPPLPNE